MFIFKNKPLVVDAFTFVPITHELFPIKRAIYSLPDWWKNLPNSYDKQIARTITVKDGTMKNCSGFKELYKSGFMLSMWTDLKINIPEDYTFTGQFDAVMAHRPLQSIGWEDFVTHSPEQYNNVYSDLVHCKLMSPWFITQKQDFKWMWSEPTWNTLEYNSDVKILPGVIDFKNQNQVNVNLFLKKSGHLLEIDAGKSIAQLIPLTDRKIEIKNHLVTAQEWIRIGSNSAHNFKFFNGYSTLKNKRKELENEKKCPFHFG
jgi:hypothetical protein